MHIVYIRPLNYNITISPLEMLSMKSAEVLVACAFKEAFVKAVTRGQLMSAARKLLSKEKAAELRTAEKQKMIIPLALAVLKNRTVGVRKGQDIQNLIQNSVKKIGKY